MRVFVTGASGFIGSALVKELLGAGHKVLGLVRSDAAAASLQATGAEPLRGSLEDLESLKRGAAEADAVAHLAFIHDFSNYVAATQTDKKAIEAMGSVLAGSDRPLIVTSGTALLSLGRPATEQDVPPANSGTIPRVASEEGAAAARTMGAHASALRLPPSVHGEGDKGFVPMLIETARQKGVSAYIGEGNNRWSAVHRLDAVKAFRLALEEGCKHPYYHAVGDEGITTRAIAEMIGTQLDIPVVSLSPADAAGHFGWLTAFFSLDAPATATLTRQWLGWSPTHPGLLEDLQKGGYF